MAKKKSKTAKTAAPKKRVVKSKVKGKVKGKGKKPRTSLRDGGGGPPDTGSSN